MVRTQVLLPDELYRRLREYADSQEWSLAETIRRASEMLVGTAPKKTSEPENWKLPGPFDMGKQLVPDSEWTELANIGHLVEQLRSDRKLR